MPQQDITSSAYIAQRVPKDDAHPYGIVKTPGVPTNKPCIVVISGEETSNLHEANYYASMMNQLLNAYNISGVNIYATYYDFDNTDRAMERSELFKIATDRLNKHKAPVILSKKYISDLYDLLFRPRIADTTGKKFFNNAAKANMHNLVIFTHSHGGAVIRALQTLVHDNMKKLGYKDNTIRQIMKHVLVVQHAPVAPIDNPLFNTISFISAKDTKANTQHNAFAKYIFLNAADVAPSYFEAGKFFTAYEFTHQLLAEHQIVGLVPTKDQDILTPDGAIIMTAERNAIINGICNAINGTRTLSVKSLISPISQNDLIKPDFKSLKQNGDFFTMVMMHDLRAKKPENNR